MQEFAVFGTAGWGACGEFEADGEEGEGSIAVRQCDPSTTTGQPREDWERREGKATRRPTCESNEGGKPAKSAGTRGASESVRFALSSTVELEGLERRCPSNGAGIADDGLRRTERWSTTETMER